jgi:hypothetical protein
MTSPGRAAAMVTPHAATDPPAGRSSAARAARLRADAIVFPWPRATVIAESNR